MAAAIEAELRAVGLADAARQSASPQREAVSAARHVIEAFGTPAHAQRAPSASAAPAVHDCRQDWRAALSDAVHWTQQTAHVVAQDIDTVHSELAAKLQLMPHGMPAEFSAAPLGQLELAAEKAGFLWKEGAIASLTSMHKCWCLLLPAMDTRAWSRWSAGCCWRTTTRHALRASARRRSRRRRRAS